MKVNFSYLDRQFAELKPYLSDLEAFVKTGDFTLGVPLREFEARFAAYCGLPFAVGVGTGTDAITMSLKVMGIGPGDEVITTPMTFIATVGAIAMTGARPVFVDSEDGFVIDPAKIETAITDRTKAIVPVHYSGNVADMPAIADIATRHNLLVVEDACQAIGATLGGMPVGSWGGTACFSLHPLKNLNVWGDGGVIVTGSEELAQRLRLFRNHGLVGRDQVEFFGCNSRLDTLQAVIGNRLMKEVDFITAQRIANAKFYDTAFSPMRDYVLVPTRRSGVKHVFHLYMLRVKDRDRLLSFLQENGIDARIHYPIPVHLQKGAQYLGYKAGDFPVSEQDCKNILTLPAHQHLSNDELSFVVDKVAEFYHDR